MKPVPPSAQTRNLLRAGERLNPGESLISPSREYELAMQEDGNLVLYHDGASLWASNTYGDVGAYAVMQEDGNLVVYKEGAAEWNSHTWGFPGAYLDMQDDSNLVIYQDGRAVWDRTSGYLAN